MLKHRPSSRETERQRQKGADHIDIHKEKQRDVDRKVVKKQTQIKRNRETQRQKGAEIQTQTRKNRETERC